MIDGHHHRTYDTMIPKWVCQLQATTSTLPIILLNISIQFHLVRFASFHSFIPTEIYESINRKIRCKYVVYMIQTITVTGKIEN